MATISHQLTAADGLQLALKTVRSRSDLARRLNIRPHSILKWEERGFVPIKRVPAVSRATGVPPHLLRPDLPDFFPPPLHQQEVGVSCP